MAEIKKHVKSIGIMKWVMLIYLPLTLFGSLGELSFLPNLSQSIIYSVDSNQAASEKIGNFDLSSFHTIIGDFEMEVEDDDDRHESSSRSSQPSSFSLILHERISVPSFSPKSNIKLFILFHSWKSFLHT